METLQFQIFVFSITVYGGIIIGLIYDIYRAVKGVHRSKGLITSLWDILFLLLTLLIAVWAIFSSNYGDLRVYVFIGFMVGFFLYEKIISRIAVAFFSYLLETMRGMVKRGSRLIVIPLRFIWYFFVRPFYIIKDFFSKKLTNAKKKATLPKKLLRDARKYYKLIIKREKHKQDA
ncbi:spore cortex biosynthesis protein YabQ [Lutispora thermophila]|uniref:Spore cortex biosynthesis protein YabQ n=1 Tax=Lutispora thermophila DSM 19022 TaxID=1122184 RepID=A0A1M6GEV2_9FIRM|nr:spore cortex biosynthesis protein YabQ [Lutispora thermophila]SHJ08490.1 spore cortex biosynthesis protein YabQ [Lutispora thermophila DSM 19022]